MPEPKPKPKTQDPTKIIVGFVVMIASIGMVIHRIPKREYVAAHADKPRPTARADNSVSPDSPPAARQIPRPEMPQTWAARPSMPATTVQPGAPPPSSLEEETNMENACQGEIGLLCYKVAASKLQACLSRDHHYDALRKSCREALDQNRR